MCVAPRDESRSLVSSRCGSHGDVVEDDGRPSHADGHEGGQNRLRRAAQLAHHPGSVRRLAARAVRCSVCDLPADQPRGR